MPQYMSRTHVSNLTGHKAFTRSTFRQISVVMLWWWWGYMFILNIGGPSLNPTQTQIYPIFFTTQLLPFVTGASLRSLATLQTYFDLFFILWAAGHFVCQPSAISCTVCAPRMPGFWRTKNTNASALILLLHPWHLQSKLHENSGTHCNTHQERSKGMLQAA